MKSAVTLDPENVENAKDVERYTNGNYTIKTIYNKHLIMADGFWRHSLNHD